MKINQNVAQENKQANEITVNYGLVLIFSGNLLKINKNTLYIISDPSMGSSLFWTHIVRYWIATNNQIKKVPPM